MKKQALVLAFALVFTSIIPFASHGEKQYDEKLEEAVLKAKDLFNISDEYDKFNSSVNTHEEETTFNLNWRDTEEKLNNIRVSMDMKGNIISYSAHSNRPMEDSKLPKYSREQAKDIADDFISRISPDIKSIKISKDENRNIVNDRNYSFRYTRYINEIEYRNNNINIDVNKHTGEVENYYVNWDRDIDFPSPQDIIDIDKAKQLFKEKIGLKPVYKASSNYYEPVNSDEDDKATHYIAYTVLDKNKGIDAFTGEKINTNQYIYDGGYGGQKMEDEASMSSGITPEERDSIDDLKNILSAKQAEEKMRKKLDIESKYEIQNQRLYKDRKNPKDYIWDMYFVKSEEDDSRPHSNISVGIDAKTGELLSFYKSVDHSQKEKNEINRSEALKLAKDYLNKENPERKDKIELIGNEGNYVDPSFEPRVHNFSFIRKEDEMYVLDDGINIGMDAVNGEIISYSLNWYKGEFPSSRGMISIESAYDALWEEIGMELIYVKVPDSNMDKEIRANRDMMVKLVYSLNPHKPAIIDGMTGEILDYSGNPYKENEISEYEDVDKSYAKDKIKTLAEYNIGFQGKKFLPEDKIKQKEYILLLWQSIYQYRTDLPSEEDMYNDFIRSGYMEEDEKDPDSMVTKIEGTKYIIRIIDLKRVAEIEGIYKDIFSDGENTKENEKGYINLAYGLNIINGNNTGNINPDYQLKRQDAASMIYNYLFR